MTNWSVSKNIRVTRWMLVLARCATILQAAVFAWGAQKDAQDAVEFFESEARRIDFVADRLNERLQEIEAREKEVARREKELGIRVR